MQPAVTTKTIQWQAAATLYGMLIAILSLSPAPANPPPTLPHIDKWVHFGLYAVFMFLLQRATEIKTVLSCKGILLFMGCSAYGVLMELGQHTLAFLGRTGSVADVFANTAGAAAVSLAMHYHVIPQTLTTSSACSTSMEIQ